MIPPEEFWQHRWSHDIVSEWPRIHRLAAWSPVSINTIRSPGTLKLTRMWSHITCSGLVSMQATILGVMIMMSLSTQPSPLRNISQAEKLRHCGNSHQCQLWRYTNVVVTFGYEIPPSHICPLKKYIHGVINNRLIFISFFIIGIYSCS